MTFTVTRTRSPRLPDIEQEAKAAVAELLSLFPGRGDEVLRYLFIHAAGAVAGSPGAAPVASLLGKLSGECWPRGAPLSDKFTAANRVFKPVTSTEHRQPRDGRPDREAASGEAA